MRLLSIFFVAVSFSANAQMLNKIDSLGNRQGVWEEYYKTGKIKSKAFYIDNLPRIFFSIFYDVRHAEFSSASRCPLTVNT